MKKIVFVEDEYDVRQSIISLVDWHKFGFDLVGQASNGQEALTVIEECQPDVVLTDIRMPIMDGIEMSRYIHEMDPTIKIIFLSGHEKFEYAQSAIQLNVQAYLLKPVSVSDMEKALEEVSKAIDKERQQATDIQQMTKEYMRTLEAIRRSYLTSLVTENFDVSDESQLEQLAALYQANLLTKPYRVLVFTLREQSELLAIPSVTNQLKDIIFAQELSWVSYIRTMSSIALKYTDSEVFRFNDKLVLILSNEGVTSDSQIDMMIRDIQQTFVKTYSHDSVVGVGRVVDTLHDIRKSYQQALEALNYCRSNDDLTQVYASDIQNMDASLQELDSLLQDKWLTAIKVVDEPLFEQLSERIYNECVANIYSAEDAHVLLVELVAKAIKVYRQNVTHSDKQRIGKVMNTMMQSQSDLIDVMYQKFMKSIRWIFNEIKSTRHTEKEGLTTKAIKIMQTNYTDPNLNQRSLAQMLHISPNYLSSLFKRETDLSFKEHLIAIRMAKAKELLMTTDKKILEIAQLTGYTDQHYFSYGFKKYFGQSPRQMREAVRELEGNPADV